MITLGKVLASLALLATGTVASAQVRLQGGGATFPQPIYSFWIQKYAESHPQVKIDYQAQGSGFGIKGITSGALDFAGSDAPMNPNELQAAGGKDALIEIPSVAGAVVVAYNLPQVHEELKLDGRTVAEIFLGTITRWNDPKIAALNPGVSLPAAPISTVHRADASGTNFVFTKYLSTQSPDFNKKPGSGKSVDWPNGQGGNGNPGVAQIVKQTSGSVGYLELAYAVAEKIPFALLKNKDGEFVRATPETVTAAGEGAVGGLKGNLLAANIWNQPGKDAYPISSSTYLIVRKDLKGLNDKAKAEAIEEFLRWALTEGEKLAPEKQYAALSPGVSAKALAALNELSFNGQPLK